MRFEQIRLETVGSVALVTLNRPDRLNAFTPQMGEELIEAFDATDSDDDVRAVVVTGEGRGFCAGADLADGSGSLELEATPSSEGPPRDPGGQVSLRIFRSKKPVIAAINGPAVGVGITMTLPMDIRLAAEGAKIGFVFSRLGVVPEGCSTWFLPRLVGISKAFEWVSSGRIFDASEAIQAGLLRDVHAPDDLLPAAYELALQMTAHSAPVSVAMSRQMLWTMLGAPDPVVAHEAESAAFLLRGSSADCEEGLSAFLEKREPVFTDRVSECEE
jgi:enoyl-CoA hydratase/carnithine racemase